MIHGITMPIRPEHQWLYPIDWSQVSIRVRFNRAAGRCDHCRRPHGRQQKPLKRINRAKPTRRL